MIPVDPAAFHVAPPRARLLARRLPVAWLAGALAAWLGMGQLLAWRFMGVASAWAYAAGGAAVAVIAIGVGRAARGGEVARDGNGLRQARGDVSVAVGLGCLFVALLLFALGGEGRFFYANQDWRVRDGVLHDMATHPWPYAYLARGLPEMLRAPVGMYLAPALAMAVGGQQAGDVALLAQNAGLLALLLALAAPLFAARARMVALAVFLGFSGLDIVGAALVEGWARLPDHLEWWSPLQYSSTVTLAFWAPQHALAGWIGAVAFLRWRAGALRSGGLLALVPLAALWSPLGAIGTLPFAMLVGLEALARRELRAGDVALPLLASALALPGLAYMATAPGSVGGAVHPPRLATWALFEALEVVPLLWAAAGAHGRGWARATLPLIAALLLALPWVQLGFSADLMTRASVPALAVLAAMVANALVVASPARRAVIGALLAVGAATGWHEARRAIAWAPSPPPLCSFFGAWGPGDPALKSTYLAPVASLPAWLRPARVALVPAGDPPRCWARPWPVPTGI